MCHWDRSHAAARPRYLSQRERTGTGNEFLCVWTDSDWCRVGGLFREPFAEAEWLESSRRGETAAGRVIRRSLKQKMPGRMSRHFHFPISRALNHQTRRNTKEGPWAERFPWCSFVPLVVQGLSYAASRRPFTRS